MGSQAAKKYIEATGLTSSAVHAFTGASTHTKPIITSVGHTVTSLYTTTATITATELANGWIGYTGAGHTLTLPSATLLAAAIGGATQGTEFSFIVQATTGICTIAAVASIVNQKQFGTTDAAVDTILTVAAGAVAKFLIVFTSGTTARISRVM